MNYQLNDAIRNLHPKMYCTPCIQHQFKTQTKRLSTFEIVDISCKYLHINKNDIVSKKRYARIVDARYLIADMLYYDTFLNLSLKDVGLILGGRDHTTILHGLKMVNNMIFAYPDYKEKLLNLHLHVYHTLQYFKH